MRARLVPIALAAVAFAGAAARAAPIVVEAQGPIAARLPVGAHLPEAYRLTLGPDDSLTIANGGATRTLHGPGAFTPASATMASDTCRDRNALGSCRDSRTHSGGMRRMQPTPQAPGTAPATAAPDTAVTEPSDNASAPKPDGSAR